VGVWKYIRQGWEIFSKFVIFKVGDGHRSVFGMIFAVRNKH
jgi:hypothetical protein